MAQGHETFYGQKTGAEYAALEASKAEAWAAYGSLQPSPGWTQNSIDHATAAARAQFELDKARGYR